MARRFNIFTKKPDFTGEGTGTPSATVSDETTYGVSKTAGVASAYSRGDHTHGTPATPTKTTVGLPNVDNTSDAGKPVSTAQQAALDGKISHALATAVNDFLVASGAGVFVKKTLAEVKTILGLGTAAYTAATDYLAAGGTAVKATILATARTIAGTSFDGSANIDISYNNLTNKPTIPTLTSLLADPMAENTAIILDAALSADGKYSGIVETGTAGATLAFGNLVYFNNDDSRWELVDANLSDGYDKKLGMVVQAAAADGDATTILLYGKIRADAAFPDLTIGAPVYMSETAGNVVTAQPTTTDACIRIVGFGVTINELFFCPSPDYMTHV